ncbi:MAG TPA: ABC transporter ATP-binding protein [Candidatus Saccharibacteria bacterium]|nr:ABC transporter ATP-binding protein [Candidatus Saccharibacteria bacterium]HRQ06545.1 ABC transporter ATP-binding protein [Candidatus Saccharibacteria bacterium]
MLIGIPIAALFINTALPYFLSLAVGTLTTGDSNALWQFIALASGAAIVGVILNLVGFQSAIHHESHVRRDLANHTIEKILIKDQDFFSNQKIGALTGKFIDFVNAHVGLQDIFVMGTLSFVISVGSGIAIIFMHSPLLGFIILGLIIGLIIQIQISIKIRKPYRTARKKLVGEVNGAIADSIGNSMIVKTFAGESHEQSTISKLTEKYRKVYQKDFRMMSVEGSLRILVMSIVQIIAVAILAQLLFSGQLELGVAIFTIAYLQRIASQLFSLGDIINGYDRLFIQAAPMTEILMQSESIIDQTGAKDLSVKQGKILFSNVNYSYQDSPDILVLSNLTLNIADGEKVGLVGASGAGKTTITKLLLRFDDVSHGAIYIDGQDISHVTQTSLRKNISYVPQEPALFHRSLKENIAYGNLNANDKQVRAAAKKANALDFIDKLPDRLDTVVGERGVKLSGGQRQRIAIARAILKDAPILVLDEATSALDSESEKLIQDALVKLMKGRTSIVIAHRLSTIAKLDRIIVLDDGKIIEEGTHASLLKHGGKYSKLWQHQSGGFIEG